MSAWLIASAMPSVVPVLSFPWSRAADRSQLRSHRQTLQVLRRLAPGRSDRHRGSSRQRWSQEASAPRSSRLPADAACRDAQRQAQLAYASVGQIFVSDLARTNVRRLTSGAGLGDSQPAWSPDGTRIAFVRDLSRILVNSGTEVYIMNANGTDAAPDAPTDSTLRPWSPDGGRLALARGDCIYHCDIYVLDLNSAGSLPVRVAIQAAFPAWSPDGAKIAYVEMSGDDGYHALHVMRIDGSEDLVIVPRDSGGSGIDHPTWSPDGRKIAFTRRGNVFTVDSDGSLPLQLTSTGNASSTAWSPDGAWIAVTLWLPQGTRNEAVIALVGSNVTTPPVPIISSAYHPAWRPSAEVDGRGSQIDFRASAQAGVRHDPMHAASESHCRADVGCVAGRVARAGRRLAGAGGNHRFCSTARGIVAQRAGLRRRAVRRTASSGRRCWIWTVCSTPPPTSRTHPSMSPAPA